MAESHYTSDDEAVRARLNKRMARHAADDSQRETHREDPRQTYADDSLTGHIRSGASRAMEFGSAAYEHTAAAIRPLRGDGGDYGTTKKRYITSLDGLRALAVMSVILYHLHLPFIPGGLLGVTIFFVLSGYLITGLLVKEYSETGRIDLPHFWLRRIRRLFPAIVLVIVVMAAVFALFNHVLLTKMRPDILPSLVWMQNWWYIFHDVSYFEALGAPSPLTHFWSLAIEEQFYVVWPLILLAVFKLGASSRVVRRACLALAVLSAVLMAVLYTPGLDPSRVYYGTDTRAFSLLVGAWLSFVWSGQVMTEESTAHVSRPSLIAMDAVGILSLAVIVVIMLFVDGQDPWMFYGGIFVVSILTAIVAAVLVHPRSLMARVFEFRPFVWIGERSYGMYLWHFPIILLFAPLLGNAGGAYPWWLCLVIIALIFVISHLSYEFIENPVRQGAIGTWLRALSAGEFTLGDWLREHLIPVVAGALVVVTAVVGCIVVPDTSQVDESAIVSTGDAADRAKDLSSLSASAGSSESSSESELSSSSAAEASSSSASSHAATGEKVAGLPPHEEGKANPLFIGDSVPGAMEPQFKESYPNGVIDTYVGRNIFQAQEVLQDYVKQDVIGHVVILEVFTNHKVDEESLNDLVKLVPEGREVFLVNAVAPDDWIPEQNELLERYAADKEHVHIIDWKGWCEGHEDEWIYEDGTHLREGDGLGADQYAQIILDAVAPYLPDEDVKLASVVSDAGNAGLALDDGADETTSASLDDEAGETSATSEGTSENMAAQDGAASGSASGELEFYDAE